MLQKTILTTAITLIALMLAFGHYSVTNAQAACTLNYTVQRGDTLYRLSQKYGVTIAEIQRINGMESNTTIYAGQKLCIQLTGLPTPTPKPPVGTTYIVQKGDTLANIARRYGVSWRVVAKENKIANANLIYVGQKLIIPDFTTQ